MLSNPMMSSLRGIVLSIVDLNIPVNVRLLFSHAYLLSCYLMNSINFFLELLRCIILESYLVPQAHTSSAYDIFAFPAIYLHFSPEA